MMLKAKPVNPYFKFNWFSLGEATGHLVDEQVCLPNTDGGLEGLSRPCAVLRINGKVIKTIPPTSTMVERRVARAQKEEREVYLPLEQKYGPRDDEDFQIALYQARCFAENMKMKRWAVGSVKVALQSFTQYDWEVLPMLLKFAELSNKRALRALLQAIRELEQESGQKHSYAKQAIKEALSLLSVYPALEEAQAQEGEPLEVHPQIQPNAPSLTA